MFFNPICLLPAADRRIRNQTGSLRKIKQIIVISGPIVFAENLNACPVFRRRMNQFRERRVIILFEFFRSHKRRHMSRQKRASPMGRFSGLHTPQSIGQPLRLLPKTLSPRRFKSLLISVIRGDIRDQIKRSQGAGSVCAGHTVKPVLFRQTAVKGTVCFIASSFAFNAMCKTSMARLGLSFIFGNRRQNFFDNEIIRARNKFIVLVISHRGDFGVLHKSGFAHHIRDGTRNL
jgi:hypothetical protein